MARKFAGSFAGVRSRCSVCRQSDVVSRAADVATHVNSTHPDPALPHVVGALSS